MPMIPKNERTSLTSNITSDGAVNRISSPNPPSVPNTAPKTRRLKSTSSSCQPSSIDESNVVPFVPEHHQRENSQEYEHAHWLFSSSAKEVQPWSSQRWQYHQSLEASGPRLATPKNTTWNPAHDLVSVWLSDIPFPSFESVQAPRPMKQAQRNITSESMAPDIDDIEAFPKLASVAGAQIRRNLLETCRGKGARASSSNKPDHMSWVHVSRDDVTSPVSAPPHINEGSTYHGYFDHVPARTSNKIDVNRSHSRWGSGFDGPLSPTSNNETESAPSEIGSSLPQRMQSGGENSQVSSTESGSIDWERSWFKRKPRRTHNVSEVSIPDPAFHTHAIDLFSMTSLDAEDSSGDSGSDIACPHVVEHHAQFHALQQFALKSCPELHTTLDKYEAADSEASSHRNEWRDPASGLSAHRPNTKRPRETMRDAMSRRLHSLGRRFHRTSSNYSVRPDFPAHPHGKDRRLLARNSSDICPSSGDENPVFNSPASDFMPDNTSGKPADLLDKASIMIAAAELDRLSSMGGRSHTPKDPETSSSLGIPPNTPSSPGGFPSGAASPSSAGYAAAAPPPSYAPPSNTSASGGPSGVSTPARRGQRRRAARSRLSEVTTPEDLGTADSTLSQAFTPPMIDKIGETVIDDMDDFDQPLYPRPLMVNRSGRQAAPRLQRDRPDVSSPKYAEARTSPIPTREAEKLVKSRNLLELSDVVDTIVEEEANTIPVRTSSIGKTSECGLEQPRVSVQTSPLGVRPHVTSTVSSPGQMRASSPPLVKPIPIRADTEPRPDALPSECINLAPTVNPASDVSQSPTSTETTSCHPDTWTDAQGEPGDSDPFCPPACETRHSHETAGSPVQPMGFFRKSTSGTVHILDAVESSGSEGQQDKVTNFRDHDCVLEN
ncbi:uncharacterized protein BCR38DRAFT_411921 [Pseudomassariella vexata]|uniref:Uncharacterized protein n=1 Tax=Pseudomassariella vexata TaxID=1141098 RepID=A0A1Y2DNR0_9PEZI|nr:uncharacterized protein BCR38DRAFT_411921 [Pseudomassariella vexata]ORY60804.1 hypothetical protein BCR38DRAFT_411921 [Pseudomassariella vexata]